MSRFPAVPWRLRFAALAVLGTLSASPALAQEAFGPNTQLLWVSGWEFESIGSANHLLRGAPEGNGAYLQGSGYFVAPVRLPAGAFIDSMRCFLWDDADATKARVDLYRTTVFMDTDFIEPYSGGGIWGVAVTGGGGFQEPSVALDVAVSYRPSANVSRDFILQAFIDTGDLLRGCEVLWHRTISPAPGTASFDDVPANHPNYQEIEALLASGITSGCDGFNFCPDAPVTRAQMALFLARALGLFRPY